MDVVTFSYDEAGWSCDPPAHLDAPTTLVLVFAAPSMRDRADVLGRLTADFPRSCLVGCSSAGEILGDGLRDAFDPRGSR